jgi:hypothetical protein
MIDPSGLAGEDDPIIVTGQRGRCQAGYIQVGESACVFASATSQIVYSGNTYSFNVPGIPEIAPGVPCTAKGNRLTCQIAQPPAPAPLARPDYCNSPIHRLGSGLDKLGSFTKTAAAAGLAAGLTDAAIGGLATAPAGGEGAGPGLALAAASARLYGSGSAISTAGNILKGLSGDSVAWSSVTLDGAQKLLSSLGGVGPIGDAVVDAVTGNAMDKVRGDSPC